MAKVDWDECGHFSHVVTVFGDSLFCDVSVVPKFIAERQYPIPRDGEDDTDAVYRRIAMDEHWRVLRQLIDSGEYVLHDQYAKQPVPIGSGRYGNMLKNSDLVRFCARVGIELRLRQAQDSSAVVVPESEKADVQAPPVLTVSASADVMRHSTKAKGRDTLDPVIEHAQSLCRDPKDTAQVFAQMEVLAQAEHAPLQAATAGGLKYSKKGEAAYLTRDALDKRLHPEKRKPAAGRQ